MKIDFLIMQLGEIGLIMAAKMGRGQTIGIPRVKKEGVDKRSTVTPGNRIGHRRHKSNKGKGQGRMEEYTRAGLELTEQMRAW